MNLSFNKKLWFLRFLAIFLSVSLSSCGAKKHKKRYEIYYTSLANKDLCANCEIIIPKIIHRIWIPFSTEKKEIPKLYKKLDSRIKQLHPGWVVMQWNEESINILIDKYYPEFRDTFESYDVPIKKHDAARYLILHHYGGMFIQHGLIINKNLEPLLRGYEAIFAEQSISDNTISTGFIASIPNHPIISKIILNLPKIKDRHVLQATGPYVISHFAHKYAEANKENNILVLPTKYLFPFDWNQKHQNPKIIECLASKKGCSELFPGSYGYALWSASWQKQYIAK